MSPQIDRLNNQKILNTIIAWGTRLLFLMAMIVLVILSFVSRFEFAPDIKKVTMVAIVAVILNWLVWDSYYRQQYEKILTEDIYNTQYCIHRRYYDARKNWKYKDLQEKIRNYNKEFHEAWVQDIEDITGRKRDDIVNGGYKKNTHKLLIYRLKHKKYPKTGLKTPNDVLYILSVGKADSMKVRTRAEEKYHTIGRIRKFIMSALGCTLAVSFAYDFIRGNYTDTIVLLVMNIAMLFMSMFFGATSGIKGGKLKLSTAEIVCEKLEEWRGQKPMEEPYKTKDNSIVEDVLTDVKENSTTIEVV